ncbi:hypothetical protein CLV47_112130 [Antricoccus suffuscus]|uniref:Uncharacterized protein n=1 Tax=Antricoccus suffuscus TaxID=1629062 RepID=A0A2T0ZXX6_9ACTN|nr:hypothetical protein [Antricoccus suffuscus]PRZ41097.1 hypothetical protein CLV47_112130 [Antricoccus suffuscus]
MMRMYAALLAAVSAVFAWTRQRYGAETERGDVPAWVMIVVMTAALVIAILIPFREAIVNAVQNALDSVTGT